ncbi:hypothetical protein IID22_02900 [Patescibacteria group bacterium]|nr:hypothetical protein [Patescibacteria group bacterium]
MKKPMKIIYSIFSTFLVLYLLLPNAEFPSPPSDSLQSFEPADTESPLRRAYFTDLAREEVMVHYENQFKSSVFMSINLPTYRLNYPPEEAQTLIRDQTQSTFLEEIVHPLRESLYVNGFEPKEDKDAIIREEKEWRQKITVRLVPSSLISRLVVVVGGLTVFWFISVELNEALRQYFSRKRR